jgi:predicted RNase H-like nuclease (RuvC/YqgF family)
MSYVNKHEQRLVTRRPELVRNLTYTELLTRLDTQAAEANRLIAKSEAKAQHWFEIVNEYAAENGELLEGLIERDRRISELEAEVDRLRKKVSRKSGKRKGEEWEE